MAEKEYIEREALVKRLKKEECDCEWLWAILDIPTADVAPVRHVEWQEIDGIFRCSHCGYSFEHEGYKHFFNYCPNCGARMDGDADANGNDNKTPET